MHQPGHAGSRSRFAVWKIGSSGADLTMRRRPASAKATARPRRSSRGNIELERRRVGVCRPPVSRLFGRRVGRYADSVLIASADGNTSGADLRLSRVTRLRGRTMSDRPGAFGAGRGVSAAGAMRSAPPQCEAGKRAQRFLAPTSRPVIRVRLITTGASVRLTHVVHTHP